MHMNDRILTRQNGVLLLQTPRLGGGEDAAHHAAAGRQRALVSLHSLRSLPLRPLRALRSLRALARSLQSLRSLGGPLRSLRLAVDGGQFAPLVRDQFDVVFRYVAEGDRYL